MPRCRVSAEDVERVRATLDHLTVRWSAVPLNGSLRLEFDEQA